MSLFQSREKDGTIWMEVTGKLTSDPKVLNKTIRFSVCYDPKRKKYMDCKVWKSNEVLSALTGCLEHHDVVIATGEFEEYTGKDGKRYYNINADYINGVQVPGGDIADFNSQSGGPLPGETSFAEAEEDGELPF